MSPARPAQSFDASIPVLTEVLDNAPAPVAALPASAPAEPQPAEPQPTEWEALERQLSERILQQLQSRVDFVLEQRIKDSMEEVLSTALRGLTAEIRDGLHDTLSKIVTRAVAQELTHLQAQKK
ncbi:hypothetical protein ASC94_07765 [Massilia sp. Root418]|jgi:hypothetical protein|uniref:hypothetical protein n=1 Tax=Massilia sp. Root418 TaxID=1736532 RepID=UPI0006FAD2D0|nr:hypothetical protein [Massilia sp. Root418]KQW96716.1 hypothetical protein ASC94_07765 [Massilia sp. Root418]